LRNVVVRAIESGVTYAEAIAITGVGHKGAYRAYATDERRSRSGRSTEKGPAKRLTHFSDGLLGHKFPLTSRYA
ncbi:MAG: hypothetical protein KTR25_18875, partial [Myxococcales bacterium]|nr:hypothetical protein [Myxococcales bacterium]